MWTSLRHAAQYRCAPVNADVRKQMEPDHAQRVALTALIFILPFVAWAFYGLGLLMDRLAQRRMMNGASAYNWLSLAFLALAALANRPELVGRLVVTFSISWFVARALSKKYKKARQVEESKNAV